MKVLYYWFEHNWVCFYFCFSKLNLNCEAVIFFYFWNSFCFTFFASFYFNLFVLLTSHLTFILFLFLLHPHYHFHYHQHHFSSSLGNSFAENLNDFTSIQSILTKEENKMKRSKEKREPDHNGALRYRRNTSPFLCVYFIIIIIICIIIIITIISVNKKWELQLWNI